MSTCTLADPGVAAGWPPLAGFDPFGRFAGDPDPLAGAVHNLVPIYNNAHAFTVGLGDTLPSGYGLSWNADGVTLQHDGTVLLGALDLGTGVAFAGGMSAPAAIANPEPLDDPARYTVAQQPWGGTISFDAAPKIRMDNYALWYPGASAAKNLQWRIKIDPAGTGNFTLTVTTVGNKGKPNGTYTTTPIPVGASLDTVTEALRALPNVGNSSQNVARANGKALGTVGSYDLIFEAGAFHDEIFVTAITTTGPVSSVSSRPNVFGGEGSAMIGGDCNDVIIRRLLVWNFLGDGVKFGGTCHDVGLVNCTLWASDGRKPIGGHNDGFIPKGVDNRTSRRYALDLSIVRMASGNACVYMAGGQTANGCQLVVVKRSLLTGPNKAIAQNGGLNSGSGASDCWVDSTQIDDPSSHDSGSGSGIHGVPPEYVWQNVRRSDAQGSDPRGTPIPPGTKAGVTWIAEPAGMVSLCTGGGGGDVTPPTVPTGLAASVFVGGADLSWNPSSDPGADPAVTVDTSTPLVVAATKFVAMQLQGSMKGDNTAGSDAAVANAGSLLGPVAKGGQSTHLTGSVLQLIDQNPGTGVFNYSGFSGSNRPLIGGGSAHLRSIKDAFVVVDAAGANSDKVLIAFGSEPWKHASVGSAGDARRTNSQMISDPTHNQAAADAVVDAIVAFAAAGKPITHVVHYQEQSKWRSANGLAALVGAPPAPWEADATLNPDTWTPANDSNYPSFAAWHGTKSYNVLWETIKGDARSVVNSVKVGGPYSAFVPLYPLGDGGSRNPVAFDYDYFVYWLKWSHGFDFIALDFSIVDYNDLANSTLAYVVANASAFGTLVSRVKALQAAYPFPQASDVVTAKRAAPIDFIEAYWDTGVAGSRSGKPAWNETDMACAEAVLYHQLWRAGVRKVHKWAAGGDAGGVGGTLRSLASWYRYPNLSSNPGNDGSGQVSSPNGPGAKYLAYDVAKLFVDNLPAGTQLFRTVVTDPDLIATASATKVIVTNPTSGAKVESVAGHSTTIPAKGTVAVTV